MATVNPPSRMLASFPPEGGRHPLGSVYPEGHQFQEAQTASVEPGIADGITSGASGLTAYSAQPSQSNTAAPGEELVEVEPPAAQALTSQDNLTVEKLDRKSPSYIMTVASSLIRFYNIRKGESQIGTTTKKPKKRKENLEPPCGLSCMAFPRCQRFNNIHCFLTIYCILVTSQVAHEAPSATTDDSTTSSSLTLALETARTAEAAGGCELALTALVAGGSGHFITELVTQVPIVKAANSPCPSIVFGLKNLSVDLFRQANHLQPFEYIMLSMTYDVTSCLVVVFLSFYGGRRSIPRLISLSSFLVGFGSLLFALPYFSGETYQVNIKYTDMCLDQKIPDVCKKNTLSSQSKFLISFSLGQILQGIAAIPLYVLGLVFLDGSVTTHSSGMYLGCVEGSLMVGYALGYTIGAPLTNVLENDTIVKSSKSNISGQSWHQTWWLNYVIVTVTSWSTFIPLLLFPPALQGTAKIKAAKLKQPQLDILKDKEFGTSFKDLFSAIWSLMKTPIFVFLALCRASESLVLIAGAEFLPRYIENQFIITPREATTLTGIILIPGGAIGQLLGGIIASKLEMSCKALMRFTIITSAVSIIMLVFVFFVHCNSVPFAGINEDYAGTGKLGNLTAPCNSHCHCSSSLYSTVCGRDDIGYFSPCYAGCVQSKTINHRMVYYNCSCIKDGLIISDDQGDSIDAKSGTCDAKCYKLPLFLAFVLSTVVFSCFAGIPSTLIILRIISEKHRSVAFGLTFIILRLFGTIPGPVVFKVAREAYCIFRDIDRCGVTGNCWLYDKTKMVYLLVGQCLLCKAVTIIFMSISLGLFKYLPQEKQDIISRPVRSLKAKKKKKRTKY
ncbi:PREDICTED: solute carrier organic anion transporter family member 6A1 [Condylura cristata]|uniref:solute carrier organic anion transporter family member 6A1 n=1 Tax=Condylura cristata TaxID=143302 RepID=UPI0003346BAE|nr:PREDICTED: solute carrier organic anion transporter family member 6A1 [Condylura cristata]